MRTPALVTLLAAGLAAASPSPMALNSRACARLPSGPDPNVRNQIYRVALDMGVNAKVMLAMMACAITETWVNNLSCGDKDSLGVFQQRPSMNWGSPDQLMNVTYSTRAFLRPCIALDRSHPNVDAGTLAQMVQIAEAGNQYTKNLDLARHYIQLAAEAVGRPGPSQSSSDDNNDGPTSTPRPTSTSRPGSHQTETSTGSTTRPTDVPTPTTFKLPGPGVYTLYDQHGEPMTAVLMPSALVGRIDIEKDAAAAPTPTNRPKTNVGPCARAEYPRVGDSCMTFAERYQIGVDTLRDLNEDIDSECLNLTVTEAWCVEAVNA